jgi:hypothetical protein
MGIIEDVNDPINAGRIKVRAFGFHPTIEENTVDTDDLPWAPVLATSPHMHVPHDRGELVFGAFLDGRDAQQPLIFGIIPTAKFGVPVTSSSSSGGAGDAGQVGSSAANTLGVNAPAGSTQAILETLKSKESAGSGGYAADAKVSNPNSRSSASGAYGYTDATWQSYTKLSGIGTQYTRAVDAPPDVQDAVAAYNVKDILDHNNNDLTALANVWYTGKASGNMTAEQIAANPGLTSTTYSADFLKRYNQITGTANSTPTTVPPTNPHLKNSPDVIDKFGHKALPPQATGEDQHKTPDGAAMIDGKSHTSNGYSLTHPGVPSGGSYKTGVWNARYDGSYIEMHAGPNKDNEHIKLMHRTGSHIILDQNGNVTINSVGRVHINSSNNKEEVVQGFTTNVSRDGYIIEVFDGILKLHSAGDMNITSGSNINIQAAGNIMMNAGGSLDVGASRVGISSKVGDLSMLAAEKIEIQSVGITSVNGDSVIVTGKNSIQQKTDAYILNSSTIGLKSTGDTNISTGNLVLNSSTLGLKSSGYTTIQAGGFANILGSQIHMNDGGSVGSATVATVADLEDTTGAINLPTPPAHEMGHSADVKPDPTPGNIGADYIDETK